MLEIKNIYKTFNAGTVNEKRALKGVNLTLEDGDFVTVIGGNGAGKSTLLNAIAGVWPVDEGEIIIDGKNVTKLPEHKRAGQERFAPVSKEASGKYTRGCWQLLVLDWKTD